MPNWIAKWREALNARRPIVHFNDLALTEEQVALARSAEPGEIERLFYENTGRLAHKWAHYLPIYDRAFARFKGAHVTMLEIGVSQGGSLQMWRDYFGPEATIFGIDIDPACAARAEAPNQVRIGSQADPAFLRRVVDEMGPPDIVLDDGSHVAAHQRASFDALWPRLKVGGLYVIEDVHTAYWPHMGGGYRRPGSAIEFAKTLIDDQHGHYHGRPIRHVDPGEIGAISFEDSIIIIEKVARPRPGHYRTGEGA